MIATARNTLSTGVREYIGGSYWTIYFFPRSCEMIIEHENPAISATARSGRLPRNWGVA